MEILTTREGISVHCLVDGVASFPPDTFPDLSHDRRAELLTQAGETEARTRFNTFLLRGTGIGVTLVDCGKGGAPRADGGNLLPLLAALGVAPADVTRLFLTHLHSDHCGGALSDHGPVFPNAQVVLHQKEILHWRGKDAPGGRFLDAYADRLMAFNGPADLGGGLKVMQLPGHTPGHCGLQVGQGVALVGDIIHAEHLQLPDPRIATRYDVNPGEARATRRLALLGAATRGLLIGGGHLLRGFGRFLPQGDGYARDDRVFVA